jgi:hypothetical protein
MRELTVGEEPWTAHLWREVKALAEAHSAEVDGPDPRRPFELDLELMRQAAVSSHLHVIIARKGGDVIGYLSWQTGPDVESKGLKIAEQGAWYVLPKHPLVAAKMFDASVEMLRNYGVSWIFPHHRLRGRGWNIGRFFKRRGAEATQVTYSLFIGEAG